MKPPLPKLEQLRNLRTRTRERIFLHRLCYDLKIAAVEANFFLKTYDVDVDDAGYDILADDGLRHRRFQLKTRLLPGGATSWQCHKQLICPKPDEVRNWHHREHNNRECWGYNGGLILADINWPKNETPSITYKYFDLAILMAMRDGFSRSKKKQQAAAELWKNTFWNFGKVEPEATIPNSLLLQPKNNKALLALMGFNVWYPRASYLTTFMHAYSSEGRGLNSTRGEESYRDSFFQALSELIVAN